MAKHYDQEFRISAVKLITEQRYTYKKASESLGVTVQSLRDWKRKLEREGLIHAPANETPHEEVKRLREQNRLLLMERDILKKAATYFASLNQ